MNDLNPNPIRTKWFHMFIYNYSYAHLRIFTYTWLFSLTLCPSVHCLFSVYRTVAAEVRKQIAGQYGGSPQLFKNLNVGTTASNTVSSMFTLGNRIRPICLRSKQVGCCQSVCWKMLNVSFTKKSLNRTHPAEDDFTWDCSQWHCSSSTNLSDHAFQSGYNVVGEQHLIRRSVSGSRDTSTYAPRGIEPPTISDASVTG